MKELDTAHGPPPSPWALVCRATCGSGPGDSIPETSEGQCITNSSTRRRSPPTRYREILRSDRDRSAARRRLHPEGRRERQSGDLRGARADAAKAYELRPRDPMDYLLISFPFPHAKRRESPRAPELRTRVPGISSTSNSGSTSGTPTGTRDDSISSCAQCCASSANSKRWANPGCWQGCSTKPGPP